MLGAQAPKSVRSQKMDDVIFAGTAKRPALGRAEVSITIDNADGTLGARLSEVTVTRILFRNGDSEYASTACRAGSSTCRNCCPTPASAVNST